MGRSAAVTSHQHNAALSSASQRAGSPAKLAEAIGVTLNKVAEWIGGGEIAPDVCPVIEQATQVRCDELRPDLVWVRDGVDEVLGYVVPVDGADAAYVRQALLGSPVESDSTKERQRPLAEPHEAFSTTDLFDGHAAVTSLKNGTVVLRAGAHELPMDMHEAALLAETVLNHREYASGCLPNDQWKAFAEFPHALLPISVGRGVDGSQTTDIHLSNWSGGGGVSVSGGLAGMQHGELQLDVSGDSASGTHAALSIRLTRKEADALAYALTGGNDGSLVANVARLACADMSEAIAIIERGELPFVEGEAVRDALGQKVNLIRDLVYAFENHQLMRHGNLRQGRLPHREAVDRLAEAADRAQAVMSTVRCMLLRDGWTNQHGDTAAQRGFLNDMRDVEKRLSAAAMEVDFRSEPPNAEVKAVAFRDPLEATANRSDGASGKQHRLLCNTKWGMASDASVEHCLEDASSASAAIRRIMESGMYADFEDAIWMWNTITQTCLSGAMDKLMQFRKEGLQA